MPSCPRSDRTHRRAAACCRLAGGSCRQLQITNYELQIVRKHRRGRVSRPAGEGQCAVHRSRGRRGRVSRPAGGMITVGNYKLSVPIVGNGFIRSVSEGRCGMHKCIPYERTDQEIAGAASGRPYIIPTGAERFGDMSAGADSIYFPFRKIRYVAWRQRGRTKFAPAGVTKK